MPQKGSDEVDKFHQHLISINANIQFTLELEEANGYGLPFLDTVTSRRGAAIQWRFTENQPIQIVTLIFSRTTPRATPRATKEQWLRRYSFARETFPPRVKETRGGAKSKSGGPRERLPVWLYQGMRKSAGNKTISAYHEWLCSTSVR